MAGVISRLSLTVKLPLLIASLLAAVMLVSVTLVYRLASDGAVEATAARLETVAVQMAALLARDVEAARRRLGETAADPSVRAFVAGETGAEEAARAVLRTLRTDTAAGSATEIRSAAGDLLLSLRPSSPLDDSLAAAAPPRPDSIAVSRFFLHDGLVYYEATAPVEVPSHPGAWIIMRESMGGAALRRLPEVVGSGARLLLGDAAGTMWIDLATAPRGTVPAVLESGVYERTGEMQVGGRAPLAGSPWLLAAEIPLSAVLREPRALARDLGVVALLILGIGAGLGWMVSRRFTQPLHDLTKEAEKVATRHDAPASDGLEGDEIARLATAFRTMVGRVDDAQARLHASEAQYRLLFDLNPNPMWVFDRETLGFLAVNDAAVRKYGYTRDQFLRMSLADVRVPDGPPVPPDSVAPGAEEPMQPVSGRHLTSEGRRLEVEVIGRPLKFGTRDAELVLLHDVTEHRALEGQLRQAQKMEAVGRLAGGVAHDFNNILTVIQAAAEFLVADLDPADARREDAREIRAAADRASSLTRQLLAFSRQQVLELTVVNLNEVVTPLEPLLRRLVEANIEIVTRLAPELGDIEADSGQIDQVILNLVVNARDAMPNGGRIVIETADAMLDADYPRADPLAQPGPHVVLTVTDTGIGMDPETQARIFDPFFTTKPVGQGTGLGLATVYGIVKQLGGHIWVYSEAGRGTTFKIYFPRHDTAAAPVAAMPAAASRPRLSGTTVLLVEDDVAVRAAVRRVLERNRFEVVEAPNGDAALARLSDGPDGIGLILSDMVMPGLSGIELTRRLREVAPAVPLLLMSGYSEEAIASAGEREILPPLIEKPFTVERLLQKIEEVLLK